MNFFQSMLSEGGSVSHKRVISISITATICFGIVWVIIKYPPMILDTLHSAMIFVAVMSGVATVAQVVALVKGTPLPDKNADETKQQ